MKPITPSPTASSPESSSLCSLGAEDVCNGDSSPNTCSTPLSITSRGMEVVSIACLPPSRPQYQKELLYNHYLPYADSLDLESSEWLQEIKENLSKAVLLRELRPGVVTWMSRLTAYVNIYGLKFSKEDHVNFVKLAWELLTIPDMEPRLMEVFTRVLLLLLKKRGLLTPKDLSLDWRPLYKIYEELVSHSVAMNMKSFPSGFDKSLKTLIKLARSYFPISATAEILAEFRPQFCPHDPSMGRAISHLVLFLPTYFVQHKMVEGEDTWERVSDPPYTQWLDELLTFWRACPNSPSWEGPLISLLARLTEANVGLISWAEETPMFYQRLMFSFGLPVYYKKLGVGLKMNTLTSAMARWIVYSIDTSSSTLEHLKVLMSAISSYYHSTSQGGYSEKLVDFIYKLSLSLVTRLHKERYAEESTWLSLQSSSFHLTDHQVSQFCEILLPAVMDLAMSKRYIEPVRSILQLLAAAQPSQFIPPLIQKLQQGIDTLTEPHKFTAAVKCLSSVSRSLVRPGALFPLGPSHIVPLFTSVLPGIDCNDIKKTLLVFQLLSIYARLVPLSDLSAHSSDPSLAPEEKIVCEQSATFKSFLLDFMDRCFSLIENSTSDQIRQEVASSDTHMTSEENSINSCLVSCFDSLLHQADETIQVAAVNKLSIFLKGRILEPKVAGRIASSMCRICVKIAPSLVLKALLPHVCSLLVNCLDEVDLDSAHPLGDEIMFNLLLLSDLVCLPGCHLVPYVAHIEGVLKPALQLVNREAHQQALAVLRHTLHSLTHPCLARQSGIVANPSPNRLNDWGRASDLSNLHVQWFLPGVKEFSASERLISSFLLPTLEILQQFTRGEVAIGKEALLRSLKTVSSIVIGASAILKPWTGEIVCHQPTKMEYRPRRHTVAPLDKSFDFKIKGRNTRECLVEIMISLAEKMLKDREDDTKSLNAIVIILKLLMFQHTISGENLEKHTENFFNSKAKLEVKLFGRSKHIRAILLDRVVVQHEKRLVENSHVGFTATHSNILSLLVTLSTSHYSKVRREAQQVLSKALRSFPYSYTDIVDQVLPLIENSPTVTHEQFKGAMYIIIQNQLVVKHNWALQCRLWPLLVTAQHSEKPSITALFKHLTGIIHSIDNWTITWADLSKGAVDAAKMLRRPGMAGQLGQEGTVDSLSKNGGKWEQYREVTENEQVLGLEEMIEHGKGNLELYHKLVGKLCDQVEVAELQWRHYNIALTMLCGLLRHDVDFPLRAVAIFTENLIHENLLVRKASLHVVDCLMKKTKRAHPKIRIAGCASENLIDGKGISAVCQNGDHRVSDTSDVNGDHRVTASGDVNGTHNGKEEDVRTIGSFPPNGDLLCEKIKKTSSKPRNGLLVKPGEREDNEFLQYGGKRKPTTEEDWEAPRFLHKTYAGFYVWGGEEMMYAPSKDQPNLNRRFEEMSSEEKIVFNFFNNPEKVEKLVTFLCLENKKGSDSFDAERFAMFKGVFRNFGDAFLPCLREHIERLVTDHRESYQRAASELLAAIMRGSKHWPFDKVAPLWQWLVPALRTAMGKVSPETQRDWGSCFATSSVSRDPNRIHWLMEVAMEEPIRCQGSFIDTSRLYMLQGVVAHQRWRVGELHCRLLEFFRPFLHHPYNNVRSRLGAVLTNIFALDLEFPGFGNASLTSPKEVDFVSEVVRLLGCLEEGRQAGEEEKEQALRLLQTISKWLFSSFAHNLGPTRPHLFKLLPLLLGYEWYDKDPQIAQDCQIALSCLSRVPLPSTSLVPAINTIEATSQFTCWRTRLASLDFLQAVIFNNFILFCSSTAGHQDLKEQTLRLVLQSLTDQQVEVRVKAAQVLGGMIHCHFLEPDSFPAIITDFKLSLSKTSSSPSPSSSRPLSPSSTSNPFNKNRQSPSRMLMSVRHGAVLGLCSFVTAFPHTVPRLLPDLLVFLGGLLHDKQPIPATIKKTLQSFKRTHQDNWTEHKTAFTEDQLTELTNLLVSPSYYA